MIVKERSSEIIRGRVVSTIVAHRNRLSIGTLMMNIETNFRTVGDFDFDEIMNAQVLLLRVFQQQLFLLLQILFIIADTSIDKDLHNYLTHMKKAK
jgi:hypothetical protein